MPASASGGVCFLSQESAGGSAFGAPCQPWSVDTTLRIMEEPNAHDLVRVGSAIVLLFEWRNEPIHIHAQKGDAECKFWLFPDRFEIEEDFEHNLTPRLRRKVRRIIFDHFDQICEAWDTRQGGRDAG